jgi:HSP20 family protein
MAIIRWDPFREMVTLREKMNRLFEDAVVGQREEKDLVSSTWSPSVDIFETENEIVLTAELPGIEDKDIEIKLDDNTLTLKGERQLEKETQEENYHRIERSYGSFYRSFTLPHYVDQDKIKAEHEHGVLKVFIPKKLESKTRSVKVVKPEKKEKPVEKKVKK